MENIVENHPLHLVEVIVLLEGLTTSWRPHCRHPRLRDGKDGHMYKRNQTHLISQTLRVSHVDQPLSPLQHFFRVLFDRKLAPGSILNPGSEMR